MSGIEGKEPAFEEPELTNPSGAWRIVTLVVMAALGAIVLAALIFTLGEANRQRDRALKLQRHSYEVMILARALSGTIAQSEASLGRYVISSDGLIGQQYFDQWQLAGDEIDRLDQITGDNAEQQARIGALREAYKQRGDELSLTALSTRYGKNGQALARFYQAGKAPALKRINALLDQIIGRERTLLEERTGDAMAGVSRSNVAAGVFTVFGILLVLAGIALGWVTVQAFTERASARAEAEAERDRSAKLEEVVQHATAELRAQEARLRQIQKMEAVGQLTGGIAHDFNNMLAVVIGGLELAKRQLDKPVERGGKQVARHIDSAMEGANRAAALTRRLLAFSREEALSAEPIDVGLLVAGMSDLLDRTIGDTISVSIRDGGDGWRTRSDKLQLENVILNLAVNARDAMDGRGTLNIATGRATLAAGAIGECTAGDYVTIAVRDTGCGMTPDTLEHVFEPFFTTKPAGKGTGLGLSQVFAFVRQSDGEVAIDSAPGDGTTVTLYLPRHTAEANGMALHAVDPNPAPEQARALHILVVEDDPRVLAATVGALEELGHRPTPCDDPLAAPGMIERHGHIDLVISDVLMPQQTGPEMIAALTPRFPELAVLFVTGFAGEAGESEFGGHLVLRKPFTIAALERSVNQAMTAAGAMPGDSTDSIAAE
jgi:signal transduction histidine kinase/ActR/RegA family two-component response regulator